MKLGPFEDTDYNGTLSSHYVMNDEDWWWTLNWTGLSINTPDAGHQYFPPMHSLTSIWSAWPFIQMPEDQYK